MVVPGVEVTDTGPWLGDSVVGLLQDLVVRGADASVAKSAAPGDVAPTPRSSSTVSPWVSGFCEPGSPGSLPWPINWRRVENDAESAC
jgi:hypothetical protein